MAQDEGISLLQQPLTQGNYAQLLASQLRPGDVLLNLAVEVSSHDLIAWCQRHDVLYLDTGIEPWPGGYQPGQRLEQTTNHWLREQVLALRQADRTTAVIAHGANPGLISHLAKRALEQLAQDQGLSFTPGRWAELAQSLGVADAVQFAGAQGDVLPWYQAADAFVLPTLYDPQSNAVLEAMACGLPVITSTGCGSAAAASSACAAVKVGWACRWASRPGAALSSWPSRRAKALSKSVLGACA